MTKLKNHTEYQRTYRKYRVHRVIIFSQAEYETLMNAAREFGKPFSTFVRGLALAKISNQYVLPNENQSKEVKLLLTRYGTNLNQIAFISNSLRHVDNERIEIIQEQFRKMEQQLMEVFVKPPLVEDVVREAICKNPEYISRIETILNEFK